MCGIHPRHFAKVTIFRKEICKGFQTQVRFVQKCFSVPNKDKDTFSLFVCFLLLLLLLLSCFMRRGKRKGTYSKLEALDLAAICKGGGIGSY